MRALVTGITGQDGSYLAEHLLREGWQVTGLIRGQDNPKLDWLRNLLAPTLREIDRPGAIELAAADLSDSSSLHSCMYRAQPDAIFNLGGISSPGMAWGQPLHTADVTGLGAVRLLQAMAVVAPEASFVQAGSIAHHGPYGAAKLYAETMVRDARERGFRASCAVFGGHHSPRRGLSFFSRKVTSAVASIADGRSSQLHIGSLRRLQDWGWADDFVSVLPRIACDLPAGDYVMSTGEPRSPGDWVRIAFEHVGLDWREHVVINPELGNVTDVAVLSAQPSPELDWKPRQDFEKLITTMVDADRV